MKTKVSELSVIQRRMLAVLADGLPHTRDELKLCLWDDLASYKAIWAHLVKIRKVLRPRNEDILCVYTKKTLKYQHVKLKVKVVN